MRRTLVEICVQDVAGARIAEQAGADRIELCADLRSGGATPSLGTVTTTLAALTRIPVHVLIRPRGGNFVYDQDEADVMLADITALRALPTRTPLGFVLSGLTPESTIDRDMVARLVEACGDAPLTFSRAFDDVVDTATALEVLIDLGFHRVLTGGGRGPADPDALAGLLQQADGRIAILAAGGVRSGSVVDLVERSGVTEVHQRAPMLVDGWERTSGDEVWATLDALRS